MKLRKSFAASMAFSLLIIFSESTNAKSHHQIGSEWGKAAIPTNSAVLAENAFIKSTPFAQKIAEATAWLTQPAHNNQALNLNYLGSAHLLGVFDGKIVMMTNSHLVHEKICNGVTIEFVFLPNKPKVICTKVFYRAQAQNEIYGNLRGENP